MENQFLVFAFNTYYPSGGGADFIGAVVSVEAGKKLIESKAERYTFQEGNIFSLAENKVVASFSQNEWD